MAKPLLIASIEAVRLVLPVVSRAEDEAVLVSSVRASETVDVDAAGSRGTVDGDPRKSDNVDLAADRDLCMVAVKELLCAE